jgi:peptidoglycan-N-acetylglucosamine deacetylase
VAAWIIRKTAPLVEKLFPNVRVSMPGTGNDLYLTFDDGPHPDSTPRILELLARHNARATFFCLGRNVEKYPALYDSILSEGHATGNHSFSHPDGWKTGVNDYTADVEIASEFIDSSLFRPPYGRITPAQYRQLRKKFTIILWTRQFPDYRPGFDPAKTNVADLKSGDILVLHDTPSTVLKVTLLLEKIVGRMPLTIKAIE